MPSRPELGQIRQQFHDWFFGTEAGGMFLTEAARKRYFALQNALQTAAGSSANSVAEAEDPVAAALNEEGCDRTRVLGTQRDSGS